MTRENAIICLKGIKNYGRDTFTEQTDWQKALDIAIKALEQESCTDAISRQAAVDAIMGEHPDAHYPDWYAHIIKELPATNPRSRLIDLYVRDKQSGKVHRIGDDRHDHLTVDSRGQVHYHNLQNGDGCYSGDGNHINGVVVSGAYGYEFVPNEDDYGYNIDPREDK